MTGSQTISELRGLLPFLTPQERAEVDALLRTGGRIDLDAVLFRQQLDFVRDPATFGTGLCTRRAGKSVGIAAWLLDGPRETGAPSLYFTITRKEAKRIIWPIMLRMNREHGLGYVPNESELTLKLNGVPMVFLQGVDTKDEIEKARGTGWGRVAGDEAQALPQYVDEMVNDVLMPSFMDHDGKLRLIGTPGAVPAGFFFDKINNAAWSHHSWTVWDNPHLPGARAKLDEVLKARGVTEDDPSVQREWFGRWVYDPNALVFKFDPARNVYRTLPDARWRHVIGVDLGYDDADAVVVLAFADNRHDVYMVEERVTPKQIISALADTLDALVARYDPVALVMDTGGLGKKIAEELTARRGLPVEAAQKTEKFAHIELVNDAFRTGRLFLPPGSRCGDDAMKLEWDRSTPERLKVSDRYHSDALDALLYSFRACTHWLHKDPPPPKPLLASAERFALEERAMMDRLEREAEAAKAESALWDDWDAWG